MSTFASESWHDLLPVPVLDQQVFINEYFARRPERMWGELALIRGPYRRDEPALTWQHHRGSAEWRSC